MFSTMARAAALGLPWLGVMAVSVGLGYGVDVALTRGVSITTPAEESVSSVIARPEGSEGCVNNGWMVYVGLGTWLPDPNRAAFCRDESTTSVRGVP
jgi:hypothetical protein